MKPNIQIDVFLIDEIETERTSSRQNWESFYLCFNAEFYQQSLFEKPVELKRYERDFM